jgi:hypothetical protein
MDVILLDSHASTCVGINLQAIKKRIFQILLELVEQIGLYLYLHLSGALHLRAKKQFSFFCIINFLISHIKALKSIHRALIIIRTHYCI